MTYENHPYADVWPSVEGADFDKMLADIKANGLKLPITLFAGRILDGRTRYRICTMLGIKPLFVFYTGTDEEAKTLVRSLNEHRRHLTLKQRVDSAKKLAEAHPEKSTRQIAAETNVSFKTVANIRTVQNTQPKVSRNSERDAKIKAAIASGKPQGVVARELGVTDSVVSSVIFRARKAGLVPEPKTQKPQKPQKQKKSTLMEQLLGRPKMRELSREEVDPEFTGTPMEFIDKYGHVQLETAEERARGRFNDWAIAIGYLAKELKRQRVPGFDSVAQSAQLDLDWLRSPRLADVERMRNALAVLEPALAKARKMLDCAEQALAKKTAN